MENENRKFRKKSGDVKRTLPENDNGVETTETEGINPEDFIKEETGTGTAESNAGESKNRTGKNRPRKNKGKDDLKLGDAIYAIHEFLSFLTGLEDLKITKEQGDALGSSIDNLELEFATKISKKTIAVIQLAIVASSIYIPKVITIKNKLKENKLKKNEIPR